MRPPPRPGTVSAIRRSRGSSTRSALPARPGVPCGFQARSRPCPNLIPRKAHPQERHPRRCCSPREPTCSLHHLNAILNALTKNFSEHFHRAAWLQPKDPRARMTSSIADRLREERDRFVGFAFANADLLLELDRGSKVQWVGGAVKSILDVEADVLIDKPFTKSLSEHDVHLLTASLRNLVPGHLRLGLKRALRPSAAEPHLQRTVEACIYRAFDKADERFFLSVVRAQVTAAEQGPARQHD